MERKQELRQKFIESLDFEGWSQQALEKAAKDIGLEPGYLGVMYPGGIAEFTNEFVDECNNTAFNKTKNEDFKKLRTTQKVEELIYQRIATYHRELGDLNRLRKFAGYSANPAHVAGSARNIYDFASDVWYSLNDKSTDISYYTKRLSLSAIYTKSMLYSLGDKSDNLQQTRKFIQKSIDGLMKINKLKQKLNDFISYSPLRTKRK